MTCEVAVMNKRGIALAADSAVTLTDGAGNNRKNYYTAEKLFSLSPALPVAIMTYGPAEIMGVPWETVVKIYAQKLGGRQFGALSDYAGDFLGFIEGATWLFPAEAQSREFQSLVYSVWSGLYREELEKLMKEQPGHSAKGQLAALAEIIERDHQEWLAYEDLQGVPPDYGALILKTYQDVLDEVEQKVFADIKLSASLKAALRKTVRLMVEKEWFHPADQSNVVIAGMGEAEPFPVLLQYHVGTIAAGKLRYARKDESRIGGTIDASVIPFAQDDIIHSIIGGIHPRVFRQIIEHAARALPGDGKAGKADDPERIREREQKLTESVHEQVLGQYAEPILSAVSALPRKDLVRMAEALVNLTAFLMRMTVGEDETVAEPIDVALLSKGDGFIWVRHKELRTLARGGHDSD